MELKLRGDGARERNARSGATRCEPRGDGGVSGTQARHGGSAAEHDDGYDGTRACMEMAPNELGVGMVAVELGDGSATAVNELGDGDCGGGMRGPSLSATPTSLPRPAPPPATLPTHTFLRIQGNFVF